MTLFTQLKRKALRKLQTVLRELRQVLRQLTALLRDKYPRNQRLLSGSYGSSTQKIKDCNQGQVLRKLKTVLRD
jgi:hypothetical protein